MAEKTMPEKVANHNARIKTLETATEDQWTAINKIRDRLPNWAVFVISLLSAGFGSAITVICVLIRIKLNGAL